MDSKPLVTVIIPSYNHETYIEHCLKSITNQSYNNIELIVVDDKSSDNSFSILQRYIMKFNNRFVKTIVLQNEQNAGVTKTLNKGIKLAQGKYIKLISSDDLLTKYAIERLVDYYEKRENCVMIFSNIYLGDETTIFKEKDDYQLLTFYKKTPKLGKNTFYKIYLENFIVGHGAMLLKTTFEKYGLYDENIAIEDWEYWLRISKHGNIEYVDIISAVYRIHKSSTTHYIYDKEGEKKFLNIIKNELKILQKYRSQAGIIGYYKIWKYCFWKVINAIEYNYQISLEYLLDYTYKHGKVLYVALLIQTKIVRWMKKFQKKN